MSKLKTVKEIINDLHKDETPEELQGIAYAQMVLENDLKQLAIEHIKENQKTQSILIKSANNYKECFNSLEFVIKWIKHFFNISEEDLK